VPHLEKLVAVISSREISLCLFIQAQSQLKALYKDHVIFLGGREHTTVKELSAALGKETISMQTESRTRGQQESYGQNTQRLGKELMTIDELTTMDGNRCILQIRDLRTFSRPNMIYSSTLISSTRQKRTNAARLTRHHYSAKS